jgi:glycosyltransferase involved in cell wall biosynthesis
MRNGRIRILFTDDSLPVGGAEHMLLQRLQWLDRSKFDVHLVTLREQGDLLPVARARADHYRCVHRQMGLDPAAILRLRRYLLQNEIQLVQTNQWLDSVYVLLAAGGLPVRKVAVVHGYYGNWRHDVNLRVLRRFDRVVSVSRAMRFDLFKLGLPWTNLATVHNSADPTFFRAVPAGRDRGSETPFRVVMVGHFRWARNPSLLVDAVDILRERGRHVELHLVGDGDPRLKADCQSLVAHRGLADRVIFTGTRSIDATWLAGFDLFVFASLVDAFAVAVLEAMATGVPVLVADIPPLMELIQYGKAGAFFEAGSSVSCADLVETLMDDENLRRSLGERGQIRALDFRVEKTTRELEEVFLGVMGASR